MSIWSEPSDQFIATGTAALIAGLAAAGGSAAANAYGAHKQAESTASSTAVTKQSNADAVAEQKRQDDLQKQEFDQQRAAEKAQWDAQQQIRAPYRQAGSAALSSLGGILGVDFGSGGGGSSVAQPTASSGGGSMPQGIDWTAPAAQLAQQVSSYFKAHGVSDQETPYWVSKAAELVARGKTLNNPNYPNERLSQSEIFGGGGRTGTTPISALMPKPLAPPIQPMMGNPLAPSYNPVVPITSLMGAR